MRSNIKRYGAAPGVAEERTNFRDDSLKEFHKAYDITGIFPEDDEEMSGFHRLFGSACAATDIDFLLVEYTRNSWVSALLEYKCYSPRPLTGANYNALINLCDRADVPLFVVFYNQRKTWFTVRPLGRTSTSRFKEQRLSRCGFVDFCHELRGVETPKKIRDLLTCEDWCREELINDNT